MMSILNAHVRAIPSLSALGFSIIFLILTVIHPSFLFAATETPLSLTVEERAYLESRKVLRLGIGTAFLPFMFVEGKGKDAAVFKGIVSDYVDLLSERFGVRMEPVFGIPFKKALEMGRNGEIDVFPALAVTPERQRHFAYTKPYISYPLVIVARDDVPFIGSVDDLNGKTIAVVKHLATYSKYVNDFPHVEMTFRFEKDLSSVLGAIANGDADACVVNLAVASYYIAKFGWANLKVAAPTPWAENKLAMAVPKDRLILASILQKGLDSITFAEADEIRQRWIGLKTASFADPAFVRQMLIQGVLTVAVILGFVLLWNRRLKRESRVDSLTGVNNHRHFFELMEKEVARANRYEQNFAVLALDLDHFKSINDTYGHDRGDAILKAVASAWTGTLRTNDILGRIGGEEFSILLPQTNKEQAVVAAGRLIEATRELKIPDGKGGSFGVTASIGVATPGKECWQSMSICADKALYEAKNAGRDRVVCCSWTAHCADEAS
jgi:diguanylate cyclase (GGDEF)-like protein